MGEWGAISFGVAAKEICAGEPTNDTNIHFSRINYNRVPAADRPNLLPREALGQILGNTAAKDIKRGQYLTARSFNRTIDSSVYELGPAPQDHPTID